MVIFLSLLIIVLLLLGAPMFTVILAATALGFYVNDVDLTIIAVELYRIIDTPLLVALPLFTFSGYILSESNTSSRLLRLTQVFFGWMPDGLAIVALVACAMFTAFTGASGVTIVALGALLLPALQKAGYQERFSLGLLTSSGSLGLLLPPSVPLILYGIIIQQMGGVETFTFEQLFLAGLLPGLLMLLILALWVIWINRKEPLPREPFDWSSAWKAILQAKWEIPLPLFILGGIFSGIFAVSEVAAVTALYVLIVEVFIYKEIELPQIPRIMSDAMMMVGCILLILGVSMAFTNFLIDAEVPSLLFDWIKTQVDSKWVFLLLLNVFLLIVGAIIDIFSALVIVVPIILPVAMGYGIHPLHLGIVFLANMQIGYFTPPVGMNLFVASYRFNRPVIELYQACIPFMMVLLMTVLIITYWEDLTLMLVR